ncbi:MAG: hypothetical protein ABW321_10405 [Polyangiales bacterium]
MSLNTWVFAAAGVLMPVAAIGCSGDDDEAASEPGKVTAFIGMENGAPETTLWDAEHSQLYVVDNTENRIWTWTEKNGLAQVASLPAPDSSEELPGNVTLGQAALLKDGTLVVTRFGQPGGGYGGIGFVRPDEEGTLVPNLDETRRRLGLALAPDGTLYGSYFAGRMGELSGFLTTVDLDAGEAVVADGFGKIVGLAIADGRLYVSDQSRGKIVDAPLDDLPEHAEDWHELATLDVPDQICVGPQKSLFSGQFQAAEGSDEPMAVRQINADGSVEVFKQDPDVTKPSGLSYDPEGRKLYVADSGNSAKIGVHVFEVP